MPTLTRWFIKSALIYFIAALITGVALAMRPLLDLPAALAALSPVYFHLLMVGWITKGIPLAPWAWRLLPAHIEFLLIGWTAQFILGVGFWILPRFSRGAARGNETFAWLAFGLANAGVCLAGVAPVHDAHPSIVLLGRLAEAGAAIAFAVHAWPRVKPLAQ